MSGGLKLWAVQIALKASYQMVPQAAASAAGPKGLDASWSSPGTRASSVGRSQAPACMLHERTLIKRCDDRIEFMGISRRTEQSGNQLDRAVFPFDDVDVA